MSNVKSHVLSIVKTIENGYKSEGLDYYDGQYEEGEIIGGLDYLMDALDIQYIVNGESEYLGARVLVAFGGPNIWIDTSRQLVEGYWWGDSFTASYNNDEMDIDGALSELWECR
jgi:hypothetical protein